MVLLKGVDHRGFVFYTNTQSARHRAGRHSVAALCFHWKSQRRQVRVRGPVTPVSEAEADAYFASRAKDSQIGPGHRRSRVDGGALGVREGDCEIRGEVRAGPCPRPAHWSGYRVSPLEIEFWRDAVPTARPAGLSPRGRGQALAHGALYP